MKSNSSRLQSLSFDYLSIDSGSDIFRVVIATYLPLKGSNVNYQKLF